MNCSSRHSTFFLFTLVFFYYTSSFAQKTEITEHDWHFIVVDKSYSTVYKKMYRWMAPLHYSENHKSLAGAVAKENKRKISKKREDEMATQAGKLQFRIVPTSNQQTKVALKQRQTEFKPMSKLELDAFIKDLQIWLIQQE